MLIYLLAIIFSCYLFTNAVEHLGDKLKFGKNATGCVLTVIGTSLPETIVPLVAIASVYLFNCNLKTNQDIATGAIIGSPFMLSCLALFLLGITLIFQKRKELNLDYKNVIRDYKYFLIGYPIAILASFINVQIFKYFIVTFLFILYCIFVYRTIIKSKECYCSEELDELIFSKLFSSKKYVLFFIISQMIISISALIIFSHLFMHEITYFSNVLKISPLILSLIVTPFATELPECVNSILWVKENKDDLAVANVLGAIIFQGMILTSIGILLTPWQLNQEIIINSIVALLSSLIFVSIIIYSKKVKLAPLLFCGMFYFSYFIWLFLIK